jgi:hypothetical protein
MKRLLILAVFVFSTMCYAQNATGAKAVVLPNPALLGCSGKDCAHLWLGDETGVNALYPKQLLLDTKGGSPYGLMAIYKKPISIDDVRAAVQQRYGKWALQVNGKPLRDIWRVETEKFVVSVQTDNDGNARVIYLAFQPLNVVLCTTAMVEAGADPSECQELKKESAPAHK